MQPDKRLGFSNKTRTITIVVEPELYSRLPFTRLRAVVQYKSKFELKS